MHECIGPARICVPAAAPTFSPRARMKFWRLSPRHDTLWWCVEGKDPWSPHRDRAFGFVVRAEDAEAARWLAHQAGGRENEAIDGVAPWLDANYSTCEELRDDGGAEVLLVNFRH